MTLPAYTGTLAPAHCQLIAGLGDQWAATVLSTDPVDRAATVAAVRRLYDTHQLRLPPLIIWMDSPLGCIYAAAVIGQLRETLRQRFVNQHRRNRLRHQVGRRLWFSLANEIRSELGGRLADHLADRLGERLRWQLSSELEEQLSGWLHDPLRRQLWGQLRGQVKGKQIPGQFWELDELWDQCGGDLRIELGDHRGSHDSDLEWDEGRDWGGAGAGHLHSVFPWNDAYELAFDGCALSIAGRPGDPCLDALSRVVAETGWLIPLPGAVIVGARPSALHRDARADLHNPAGLALAYPDGWGFHAWHGRRVPGVGFHRAFRRGHRGGGECRGPPLRDRVARLGPVHRRGGAHAGHRGRRPRPGGCPRA
jgi:hypothetical protein